MGGFIYVVWLLAVVGGVKVSTGLARLVVAGLEARRVARRKRRARASARWWVVSGYRHGVRE